MPLPDQPVYLASEDPLHHWALERRTRIMAGDDPVWVAPPEYVIIRKLQYFRDGRSPKHLTDVRTMLAVLADKVDTAGLREKIEALHLVTEWEASRRSS